MAVRDNRGQTPVVPTCGVSTETIPCHLVGATRCRGYRRRVSRKPRLQIPDVVYHVGSRGVEKRQIFDVIRGDRDVFVEFLEITVRRHRWLCHAYCLMGNHFHLAVETPEANLADGMRYLKSRYAIWFNQQNDRGGALFERRYFDELVDNEAHAYELARYIILNPVRAKLCAHPRDWRWSSYRAAVGAVKPPGFLYLDGLRDLFGDGPRGLVRYERFVEDGIALQELRPAA
jgi:putative transposase